MSAQVTAVGNITEPAPAVTQTGKKVLKFAVGATLGKRDEQSGQWEDVGEPLFLEVTLWERDAEFWEQHLTRGVRVAVTGVLVSEKWTDRDGKERISQVLANPRMLGVHPPRQQQQAAPYGAQPPQVQQGQAQYGTQYSAGVQYGQPAEDPWGGQQAPF